MSLINRVYGTLKWKKSDEYCASKLGVSLEEYKKLKKQVLYEPLQQSSFIPKSTETKHNLEKGEAEIKGVSLSEPRSPEEVIEVLKIDTTKWKLSSYWAKETHSGWLVSAFITQKKLEPLDLLQETLKNFSPNYTPVKEVHINKNFDKKSIGVLSVQDLHFGKEGNDDIVLQFKDAISNLVYKSYSCYQMDEIIYVIGGDLLNMDTFNGTTTSGTPVDNGLTAQEAYNKAFDALFWSINFIKQFCNKLHVVYIPGNHDRLSSYHIAHALSKCFSSEKSIIFYKEYSERKVLVYGVNFFAFEHGDVTKRNTPLVYATEFPIQWGCSTFRTCYTGHFHSKKTIEFVTENEHHGFSVKHLPSLTAPDYWHYHNKFTGAKRQAIMEVHDYLDGFVSSFVYTIKP